MSKSARHWLAAFARVLVLVGFAVAAMLVFALNTRNGLLFARGMFGALLLLLVLWGGSLLWNSGHRALVALIGLLGFLAANVVITLMLLNPQQTVWETLKAHVLPIPRATIAATSLGIQGRSLSREAVQVTAYHVTLTPVDQALTAFQAKVNIRFQENGQEKMVSVTPPETIRLAQSRQGWLLKEARPALPPKTAAQFVWKEAGATREAEQVCCFRPVTIVLQDVPKGVFYEARDAVDLKKSTYANTETIQWTVLDPWGEREFAEFSLVSPPYQRFPLIPRLAALSSVADWVFTLGGMIGSSVLAALLIPVFRDFGQQKVKHALARKKPSRSGAVADDAVADDTLAPLARHLSQRLSRRQLAALRNEIDRLLPPEHPS